LLTDQQVLADIAKTDKAASVRRVVTQMLTDQQTLVAIAAKDPDSGVAGIALAKLEPDPQVLARLAQDGGVEARFFAVWRLTDRELLAVIAQKDANARIRAAAEVMLSGTTQNASPKNLLDLIEAGMVAAESTGSGIESVSVSLRNAVPWPLETSLPAGAYFRSADPATQNMVSRSAVSVRLNQQTQSISVPAACANLRKDVPHGEDAFTLTRLPANSDLAKLATVLDERNVPYRIAQAAVWIVTDNADYGDLGRLVGGIGGFGPRQIEQADAARAMQLCVEAGIDIRKKSIWRDRREIVEKLEPGELKTWLENFSKS
jgi:hypothetical protein